VSKPRFLVDENLHQVIVAGVRRYNGAIDILHVGDMNAPPIATSDPDILDYCARTQRILITENRKSMPALVTALQQDGKHHSGILKVRKGRKRDIGGIVDTVTLIWEIEGAEDYLDREEWIPF
jgi:Domain of unknown function (DUF5615)